jgi:hypothetical protein
VSDDHFLTFVARRVPPIEELVEVSARTVGALV